MIDKICNNKLGCDIFLIQFICDLNSFYVYAGANSVKELPKNNISVSDILNCSRLNYGYDYYYNF